VWILDQLAGREKELQQLQGQGYQIDVSYYWTSATGHGGPVLDHAIMRRLVSLQLDIWLDVIADQEGTVEQGAAADRNERSLHSSTWMLVHLSPGG